MDATSHILTMLRNQEDYKRYSNTRFNDIECSLDTVRGLLSKAASRDALLAIGSLGML